jgi:hypothetical protein
MKQTAKADANDQTGADKQDGCRLFCHSFSIRQTSLDYCSIFRNVITPCVKC